MPVLKAKRRNMLPSSAFGLPGQRKYPVNDASHARNALARASQQVNAGNLSEAEAAQIRRKARSVLSSK
jgi:hypothetical protein